MLQLPLPTYAPQPFRNPANRGLQLRSPFGLCLHEPLFYLSVSVPVSPDELTMNFPSCHVSYARLHVD
jgi:hypothetical protein